MVSPIRRFARAEQGSVVVEFVALLPLLVLFLFMMIGVGQGLWYHQVIIGGVRDGVRYLARAPLDADHMARAKLVALSGDPTGASPSFVFWNDPATVDITLTPVAHGGAFRGPDPLTLITMTAEVPVSIPVLDFFGLETPLTLTVADQARHIGE